MFSPDEEGDEDDNEDEEEGDYDSWEDDDWETASEGNSADNKNEASMKDDAFELKELKSEDPILIPKATTDPNSLLENIDDGMRIQYHTEMPPMFTFSTEFVAFDTVEDASEHKHKEQAQVFTRTVGIFVILISATLP